MDDKKTGDNPTENDPADNAGVRLPPPFIYLGFLVLGLWYDSPWFEGLMTEGSVLVAGGLLFVLGAALLLTSLRGQKKVGTNIEPWKPTTAIVSTGIYGYTRNPMYLGMAFAYAGLAVGGASLAALVGLVPCVLVIRVYVIAREERYLEGKFGTPYRDYKKQVRRWI
jgi:protein-S-isoprenylcysteine O-methyltransferase Ste14